MLFRYYIYIASIYAFKIFASINYYFFNVDQLDLIYGKIKPR